MSCSTLWLEPLHLADLASLPWLPGQDAPIPHPQIASHHNIYYKTSVVWTISSLKAETLIPETQC